MGLFSALGIKKPSIFVQIASYRDPECQWTVKDLFEKAAYPERIFVGICWQFDKEADTHCFTVPYPRPNQVRTKKYHWKDSKGAGWARSDAQSLLQGEDYTLQIDSHMRCVQGWDELLINTLGRCPSPRAVLTASLPGYAPPNALKDTQGQIAFTRIQNLGDANDPQLVHAYGSLSVDPAKHAAPFPTALVIGNCIFAKSEIFAEFPIDPHLFFYGDEICYSARLFTHGVHMYQPNVTALYHQWDRNAINREQTYYGLKDPRNVRTRARAMHLLGLQPSDDADVTQDMDRFGLGTARSIDDYWEYLGVDLAKGVLSAKAKDGDWGAPPPIQKESVKFPDKSATLPSMSFKLPNIFSRRPTIFVQIASYRDPECQWTVKDLFEQAAHPERIFVGICWQYDKESDANCFTEPSPRPKQTRILHMKASDSEGACWARHSAQTLYKDEDYVLMIDSHMRFVQGWDDILIAELARCPSKKPLLTHYPPGYEPPRKLNENPRLSVMIPKKFTKTGDIRGDGIALESTPDQPLRGAFIAAGFVFARAELIVEVPYDPFMYFDQEEVSIALRLFTKGWDVYHPTCITNYHYYKKAGDPTHRKLLHWENDKTWGKFNERARKRFHHLIGHKVSTDPTVILEMDHYGLGTRRSIKDFETFVGIDFANLTVSEDAIKGRFVPDVEKWKRAPQPLAASIPTPPDQAAPAPKQKRHEKLSPLTVGHMLPPFILPNSNDMPVEIQLYAGRRLLLIFLPTVFPEYLDSFFTYYATQLAQLNKTDCKHLFIVCGTAEEARALKEKYKVDRPVLYDTTGAIQRAFGLGREPKQLPLCVLVNANQKILGMFGNRNAINQLADAVRGILAQPPTPEPHIINNMHPPVLMVPDVLSPAMQSELITYWRRGKHYTGTIGVGDQVKVVLSGKRRTDVDIVDRDLMKRLDDQLAKTILPEIRKVCAFEAVYRDRYKIGRYSAEDAGYYHQHRDTGVKELAHRRYSLTLPLSNNYEGGLLHFPEYGPAHYRINAGSAALFPSALLHGVTPVTTGERFVLVSFFRGPLEEAYRKRQWQESGKNYSENDVHLLVEPHYEGVSESQHLYTSSIVTRVIDED